MKKKYPFKLFLLPLIIFLLLGITVLADEEVKADSAQNMANGDDWSEAVDVSKTGQDCAFPKVTADDAGYAYIIWNQASGQRGMRFTSNENDNWPEPENITKSFVRVKEGPWPELTLDIYGNVFVVYTAVTDGNYEVVYVRRKGKTWGQHENVSRTQAAGSVSATPLVDVRTNDYFIHWQDDVDRPAPEASYWRTYIRYLEKGEGRWIGAGAIGDASGRDYGPEAAMDVNGKMYAVWGNRRGGISNVFFVESPTPKVNASWKPPINLSGPSGVQFAEPQIAVDFEGNVYVCWMQTAGGNLEVFFRKRINGVWQEAENISKTSGTSEWPTIAADRATGKVYVAWHDNTSGNWEILFKEHDGTKWLDTQNVSKSGSKSARPDIYCDSGGGIHLVYLELQGNWKVYYQKREGVYDFPIYPPLNLELTKTTYNDQTGNKTNTLTWDENPDNERHDEFQYLIYRKEHGEGDSQYEMIEAVPNTTFSFKDDGLPTDTKYWYRLKSFSEYDEESEDPSNAVTENWIWPALDPILDTQSNRFLFYKEKINTLSWSANPLNDAVTVERYDIYRKLTTQTNSEYTLLTSVGPEVHLYKNRGLPEDESYTYRIVVVDVDGVQSAPSSPVGEE
ncbi:MAG: hypothetical protein PVH84_04545 [Candidatus Aminicenantes bacterium]|jgi:hypothetical protein